jgi:hypothetical protein
MPDEPEWLGKKWDESPMIRAALRGRPPEEVSVVHCDSCGSATYYNDGSHCTCEHCGRGLDHLIGEDSDRYTMADVFEGEPDHFDAP